MDELASVHLMAGGAMWGRTGSHCSGAGRIVSQEDVHGFTQLPFNTNLTREDSSMQEQSTCTQPPNNTVQLQRTRESEC